MSSSAFYEYKRPRALGLTLVVLGILCLLQIFVTIIEYDYELGVVVAVLGLPLILLGTWILRKPLLTIQLNQVIVSPGVFGRKSYDLTQFVEMKREGNVVWFYTMLGNKQPLQLTAVAPHLRDELVERLQQRLDALLEAKANEPEVKRTYLDPEL